MAHKYKVGDTGKDEAGNIYRITAVGELYMLALLEGPYVLSTEQMYQLNGDFSKVGRFSKLIPPKRRIKGWVNILIDDDGEPGMGTAVWPNRLCAAAENVFACIEIDVEEGEGLPD